MFYIFQVNGGWSQWDALGDCNVQCGTGKQSRRRYCTNPAPANNGAKCPGQEYEYYSCTLPACPGDRVFLVFPILCLCTIIKYKQLYSREVQNLQLHVV